MLLSYGIQNTVSVVGAVATSAMTFYLPFVFHWKVRRFVDESGMHHWLHFDPCIRQTHSLSRRPPISGIPDLHFDVGVPQGNWGFQRGPVYVLYYFWLPHSHRWAIFHTSQHEQCGRDVV